jgi:type III pantothenate kinase
MLLAINANNTNVKFALFEGGAVVGEWRISTSNARTADEYAVWLTQLMTLKDLTVDSVDAAIIATVVPQALFDDRPAGRGGRRPPAQRHRRPSVLWRPADCR